MNSYRKSLSALLILTLVLSSLNYKYSLADTASTTPNIYSNLNNSTQIFVSRLNQLPQNFVFNQNLKRGSFVDPDVQYLKWILNGDQRTALTDNPNMTLTRLTATFGPITQTAVKKFQTLYKSEILDPQGITSATGVVGSATRLKLNSLLSKSRLVINSNPLNNFSLNQTNYANSTNYNNGFVDFSYLTTLSTGNSFNDSSPSQQTSSTTDSSSLNTTSTSSGPSTAVTTTVVSSNPSTPASGSGGLIIAGAAIAGGLLLGGSGSAAGSTAGSAAGSGAASAAGTSVAGNTLISQFGGKITAMMTCGCSANYMITIMDLSLKTPLSLIFQPGVSVLKMNYNPTIGETVLGGYVKGTGVCMVYAGVTCVSAGSPAGTIDLRGIGTTLSPVPASK